MYETISDSAVISASFIFKYINLVFNITIDPFMTYDYWSLLYPFIFIIIKTFVKCLHFWKYLLYISKFPNISFYCSGDRFLFSIYCLSYVSSDLNSGHKSLNKLSYINCSKSICTNHRGGKEIHLWTQKYTYYFEPCQSLYHTIITSSNQIIDSDYRKTHKGTHYI